MTEPKVITMTADNAKIYGNFKEDAKTAGCQIFNYLDRIAGSARFTKELVGTTHRYRSLEETAKSKELDDENKREYLIRFSEVDKFGSNTWFLKSVMKNIIVGDKDGMTFSEYITENKKLPVEFTITGVVQRTFMDSEVLLTSQNCWDMKKLKEEIGKDLALVFRNMGSSTQEQISEAYSKLTALSYDRYIKDIHLDEDRKLTEKAQDKFVICSLVVNIISVLDLKS